MSEIGFKVDSTLQASLKQLRELKNGISSVQDQHAINQHRPTAYQGENIKGMRTDQERFKSETNIIRDDQSEFEGRVT
jgi:hypothetical protein